MDLGGGHSGRERAEAFGGCRGPLRQAHLARARQADLAGMPGLAVNPLDRSEAVGALVKRPELASGAERAACALDHDLQAAARQQRAVQQPARNIRACLAVLGTSGSCYLAGRG